MEVRSRHAKMEAVASAAAVGVAAAVGAAAAVRSCAQLEFTGGSTTRRKSKRQGDQGMR